MSQLARHLLLLSHTQLKSLRAVHIPRKLNRVATTAHVPQRMATPSRDDPADLELIRGSSGGHVCFPRVFSLPAVFFPDRGPPRHGRTGTQLASGFTQVCISPSEPTHTDTVQAQGERGAGPAGRTALAHPDLVSQTHFPRDSPSLAHSSEEGPPFSGTRHHMAPASRSLEPPCVAPGRDVADLERSTTGSGEPASTALRGGRFRLSIAVSRKSNAHIPEPHLKEDFEPLGNSPVLLLSPGKMPLMTTVAKFLDTSVCGGS